MNQTASDQLAAAIRHIAAGVKLLHAGVDDRVRGVAKAPLAESLWVKAGVWCARGNALKCADVIAVAVRIPLKVLAPQEFKIDPVGGFVGALLRFMMP